jgi:hypothetical protein
LDVPVGSGKRSQLQVLQFVTAVFARAKTAFFTGHFAVFCYILYVQNWAGRWVDEGGITSCGPLPGWVRNFL